MNDDDDILAAVDDFGKSGKSSWLSKKPLRRDKPSVKLTFKQKKRSYKLAPVPRTEIYEPIRHNDYYIESKKSGADKDDILCGVHESTIKINKILFECFTAADLKSNERQMFLWVLSNTTGFKKREVILDVNKIAGEIGRSRSFVYTALNRLVDEEK